MADISALGNLVDMEALDLENYADVSTSVFVLPKKGEYVVQAPESFPDNTFTSTKAGYLQAQVDPTIVGPTNEGFKLRFVTVSARPYERKGVKVSRVGDYLRACGFRGRLETPVDIANAVEGTANQIYKILLDWRAYNKVTGWSIEGMEKFPVDPKGGHLSYIDDPTPGAIDPETGEPYRLRAQLVVTRFLPAQN